MRAARRNGHAILRDTRYDCRRVMRLSRILPAACFAAAAALPFACTQETLGVTGTGGSGGAGGSCVAEGDACPVVFTYPLGNEKSVELRGDFEANTWKKGVAMTIDGGEWRTSITAKNGQSIQYKFFV